MIKHTEPGPAKRFVRSFLPWLAGLGALIVYLVTINPWISLQNLSQVARNSGWVWGPELYGPVYFVVTYPIRLLPEPMMPVALNVFSAVCAALVIALLVRCVTLLPYDRTHDQRVREADDFSLLSIPAAWIPPLAAALTLGFQLTFWENATGGSNEIFDLLLFAYVVRCLLEFRISLRDAWMYKSSLVYALAMTDNWLLIALLPAYLAAVFWIKGLDGFSLRFLLRMFLFAMAGLALYLLLPLLHVLGSDSIMGVGGALKLNLSMQKRSIVMFASQVPKNHLFILSATSLVPVLLMGIRWASYFGDPSPLGTALTTAILHLTHLALLNACILTAFDAKFSQRTLGYSLPALAFLSALCVGYFIGYFLLVFRPPHGRGHRGWKWDRYFNKTFQIYIWLLVVLIPAGLIFKNLPHIRLSNGSATRDYAGLMAGDLPEKAVILCDPDDARMSFPRRLWLLNAWMQRERREKNYIFIDTLLMRAPTYHKSQTERYPDDWPRLANTATYDTVEDSVNLTVVNTLAQKFPVYYLHPSFGYYYEVLYPEPKGLVVEMRPYPTNAVSRPPLSKEVVEWNERFWKELKPKIDELVPFVTKPLPGETPTFRERFYKKLRLPFDPNLTGVMLARNYSQALVYWGVFAQREGRLAEASECFERAIALNDQNTAARVNLAFNKQLQAGEKPVIRPPGALEDQLGNYRNWQQVMRETGPVDDPTIRYIQGMAYAQGTLYRQAAEQLERVHELVPDNVPSTAWLAQLYTLNRASDRALELIKELRAMPPEELARSSIGKQELLQLEATALYASRRVAEGEEVMRKAIEQHRNDVNMLSFIVQFSTAFRSYTNALLAINHQLNLTPNDPAALVNRGYLHIQMGNHKEAIPSLDRALTLETNNELALLDRAIAYLGTGDYEASKQDYERLLKKHPNAFQLHYGLGEIGWRTRDTNLAITHYELYLTNSPSNSEEAKVVIERLQTLKPGSASTTNAAPESSTGSASH